MPSIDDLNKKLDEAGEGSQPWKPSKEGDQIAGKVTVRGSFTHPEFGTSATLTIRTDDESVKVDGKSIKQAGVMRVGMFGTVLAGVIDEHNVQANDWVAIRYLGLKKTNNGAMSYKNYAVVVEHPTASDKLDDASDFT